jgi:hypothetical protein
LRHHAVASSRISPSRTTSRDADQGRTQDSTRYVHMPKRCA